MLKFILRESFLYTLANNTGVIAGLVVTPLVTPYLEPKDYAILALAMALNASLASFGSLGMIPLFQNAFFKEPDEFKEKWRSYLGFQHIYRLFFTGIVGLAMYGLLYDEIKPEEMPWFLLLVLTPILFLDISRSVGMRLCQWRHQHRRVHISTFINGILTATTTYITIKHFELGYMGWFISFFVAALFQFFYFGWILFVEEKIIPNFRFNWKFMSNRIRIALPVVPHESSQFLLDTSDRIMLKFLNVSMQKIGLYSIAYGFGFYFNTFNAQVNTVVSPIYFKMFADEDERTPLIIRNLTLIWLGFVLMCGFLLSLWSREIFAFLYRNDSLNTAYKYSVFIIMALCYRPLYVALVDKIIFEEKTRSLLKLSLVGGILNVTLNAILIPTFGIHAAIFATFVCYMYLGFAGFVIKDIKKYITVNYRPWLLMGLILTVSAAAWLTMELDVIYKVVITLAVLISALIFYFKKGKSIVQVVNTYVIEKD